MLTLQRRMVGLSTVAVVISIAVSACGAASKSSNGVTAAPAGIPERSSISRAADVSESAKGYRFRLSIRETVDGVLAAQVSGGGDYSAVSRSLAMTLTTRAEGKSSQVQEILIGPRIWVKEPAAVAAKLPGGRPWLEIDLNKLRRQSYLGAVASLTSSSSDANPAQTLQFLKAESNQVEDLGATNLDGVPTTHYRFSVNLEKAGAGRSAAVRAASQEVLKRIPGKILNETHVPFDVWIDGAHFVREISYTMKLIPKGITEPINTSVGLVMNHYGPQATPSPPPASETGNLLAILKAEGKSADLSA